MAETIQVKILCSLPEVYPMYQPEVGKIYEAHYTPGEVRGRWRKPSTCFVEIRDKYICLRPGEYEIVGG